MHDAPLEVESQPYINEEQTDYVHKIAGMANNVNQIAHQANIAGYASVENDCKGMLNQLQTLLSRIF